MGQEDFAGEVSDLHSILTLAGNLMLEFFEKYFLHCNPTVLQLLTSSLLACVTGTVAMKLASSTDLQNVVLLHPSSITEYHIDSKSPTFEAHTKYLLQIACCLRC